MDVTKSAKKVNSDIDVPEVVRAEESYPDFYEAHDEHPADIHSRHTDLDQSDGDEEEEQLDAHDHVAEATEIENTDLPLPAKLKYEDDATADIPDGETTAERAIPKSEVATANVGGMSHRIAKFESDPEAVMVRKWRHDLQKAFLSPRNCLSQGEKMPALDTLFTDVEEYQNMTVEYLTYSKLGIVMRHIHLLEDDEISREDEFRFRSRAGALVAKWRELLATRAPRIA
ncbi:hypothetical protein B0H12DRAFT_1125374 [Mycena haematopus]|nr:hypothetical protein B0H12DRAFT_1125374 [Mycena haematopus]